MTLTFNANPAVGDVQQQPNGLQYQYDGVKWTSIGSYGTGNINDIKKLDDISSQFDDETKTFNLTINNRTVYVSSELVLNISIGGVRLAPDDYTLSAQNTQITFTDAPLKGFSFTGIIESRLPTSEVDDASITTSKLADDSVTTAKLADDSVTIHQIANDAVGSNQIAPQAIFNSDINNSAAIAQSKLNIADATTSASGYMSGADKTKLDGLDKTKLDNIESNATADQTAAEIRTLVESATDSNVFTDADHTKLNNIDVTNDRISVDSNGKFTITGTNNQYPTIKINHSNNTVEGEVFRFERTDSNNARFHSLKAKSHSSDTDENYLSFHIHDRNDTNSLNSQVEQLKITPNSVLLNYDGTPKAQTTATGVSITGELTTTGNINVPNNSKIQLGNNPDLAIFHDGSNSRIQDVGTGFLLLDTNTLMIRKVDGSATMAKFTAGGAAEMYHDNDPRLSTTSTGALITGRNGTVVDSVYIPQDPTLEIKHSNIGREGEVIRIARTESAVRYHSIKASNSTNTADNFIKFNIHDGGGNPYTGQVTQLLMDDDKVSLSYDGSEKLATTSTGISVTGSVTAAAITINDGQPGLFFVDTGANPDFVIQNRDGLFAIRDTTNNTNRFFVNAGNGDVTVTGSILPNDDDDVALGSSSKRFTTLHSAALNTGDINMSNLSDSPNEVDGTKGSWTLQEGSDDLFLINRVNGKKYKFNLTEIN